MFLGPGHKVVAKQHEAGYCKEKSQAQDQKTPRSKRLTCWKETELWVQTVGLFTACSNCSNKGPP